MLPPQFQCFLAAEESSKASLHSEDSKQQQPASASAKKSFAALARKHALPKAKKSAEDEAREKEVNECLEVVGQGLILLCLHDLLCLCVCH